MTDDRSACQGPAAQAVTKRPALLVEVLRPYQVGLIHS
jgi:hypothetical protein